MFARAGDVFSSSRPRPVHIAIPVDVLRMQSGAGADPIRPARPRPMPAADEIARAAELLAGARRPLIDPRRRRPRRRARGDSARRAPRGAVGLTINARGTVSDAHELCLGSALSFPPISELLREADATLLVGAELSNLDLWGLDEPLHPQGLVRIDIDDEQLRRRWQPRVALHGDAAGTLAALAGPVADCWPGRSWTRRPASGPRPTACRARARGSIRPTRSRASES